MGEYKGFPTNAMNEKSTRSGASRKNMQVGAKFSQIYVQIKQRKRHITWNIVEENAEV